MPKAYTYDNCTACPYLNVAGGRHIGVDPSVGPVGPPPHLGSTVHLDNNMNWCFQDRKLFR